MANINKIRISGTSYDIQDKNAAKTVTLTQSEYDSLTVKDPNVFYIISDSEYNFDGYWTSAQTMSAITAATSTKQDTLTAGRGISIANDTISFNLPISAGTGSNSIRENTSTSANGIQSHAEGGGGTTAQGQVTHAEGYGTNANGTASHTEGWYTKTTADFSHAEGSYTSAFTEASHAEGNYTKTTNKYEHASGMYNVSSSASTTFGDSGNTLFSVGNGTANNARHNAFEIRQNGDIYLSSGGTDIKLQDHLGGGSVTVDTALDSGSTNPVQNKVIYSKIDEVEQVTAAGLNALNDAVSGKQDTLVSGTNIKTINNESILGTGNIDIQGGGGTVESAITSGSTNAVESKAIWSATTFNKGVLLTFNGTRRSTNYPEGCGKLVVENIGSYDDSDITFRNNGGSILGRIRIENFGNISVDTSQFEGATATVDGNKVTIIYPSTGITYVEVINTSWTYTAVVEGAWVNENTYMKLEVDAIANGLQNNINSKLDATAYTPTVVDSALYAGSQNPVKNQALYSELRIDNGETETTLAFENRYSTNYPNGCTKLNVEVVGSNNNSDINFYNDNQRLGYISIDNWGGISVNVYFDGASYEISGTTVIITYPTVTNVTKIEVDGSGNHVYKAIVANATPLIDQVTANTTALGAVESRIAEDEEVTAAALNELNDNFGGLKLVKLTQTQYNNLQTKDNNTLYVIVD